MGSTGLGRVGVLPVGALGQPLHEVEALGVVQRHRVAIEDVGDDAVVAVGGELVGHELAVLPDADDVGNVDQADALVARVGGRNGYVGVPLPFNLDQLARGLAARGKAPCSATSPGTGASWREALTRA